MSQLLNKVYIIVVCQSLIMFGFEVNAIRASLGGENPQQFLSSIEDVPLMLGLIEDENNVLNFNKPSGRLVQVYAFGPLKEKEIINYYNLVLPEFGWKNIHDLVFVREGEILKINLFRENSTLIVVFMLSPDTTE
tara:strand:+ start:184 stop:588 length:405 start_codon:yes stop_codon:yes gene_type:complete